MVPYKFLDLTTKSIV